MPSPHPNALIATQTPSKHTRAPQNTPVAEGTHPFLAQALDDIRQNIQSYALDVLEDTPFSPAVSNIGCSQPSRQRPFPHPTLCCSPAQSPLQASPVSQRPPTLGLHYPSPIQEDAFEEDVSDHHPIHPAALAGPGNPGSTFPDTVTVQQVLEDLCYNYNPHGQAPCTFLLPPQPMVEMTSEEN
ncbi:hypothetical protein HYDPIDRAFT_35107 [Hydnomerulius pinastri MD-312]|uniref:Uncharacterized protein n=1 Tax=Hydnomerulius pinastri MD-312 TaxID=994086 RepID=A0A0C2PQZ5_9AGAM|nr:hypothetical protein HYDPIDRAFT_35107 [Hydnomerulius pinastri MD-312]